MIKYIMITAIIVVNMNADILDNAVKFWHVDKTYKQTKTYRYWSNKKFVHKAIDFWYIDKTYKQTKTYNYWSNKKELVSRNYGDYKKSNPYRAIAIESLLETAVIAVGLIGIVELGVPYIIHNYQYYSTANLSKVYKIPKYIKPKQLPYRNKFNTFKQSYWKDRANMSIEYGNILSIQNDLNISM